MNKLKTIRMKTKLTQKEVGMIIGTKRENISYYESDKRNISTTKLKKLLDFVGLDLEEFEKDNLEIKIQASYNKKEICDEDFEEVIWLNNFIKNLSEIKKLIHN